MKRIFLIAALITLAGCSTQDRYNTIATTCGSYAVALQTAAALNSAGKLGPDAVKAIDDSIASAKAVCSGDAPSTDAAAVQKIANAVMAVLQAQGSAQ